MSTLPASPAASPPAILPLIAQRRSIRAFAPTPVPDEVLMRLLEAARWAPSSRNAQPWHFIVVRRDDVDSHAGVSATLTGRNPLWAPAAPLLLVALARTIDAQGRDNRHAAYDLGQSVAQLVVQASAEGLAVHQMGGFDVDALRSALAVPDSHDPMAILAVGTRGDASALPPELQVLEDAPRSRRPLPEIASVGRYEG